ncbi:hypothetical protein GFW79_02900 [Salmonella enterica]|nr:hypothetical protein [Salmonella enterica]EHI6828943.1 hypothetical protein [Salmonella enterica]EIN1537776.1 hypothetical protein [Salmonella enterica]
MMVKNLTIPPLPHARARFAIQKDEIRPFDTNQYLAIQKDDGNFHHLNNQHLASRSFYPLPAQGGIIAKKRDFTVMTF